jgi:tetratricopeptide (TPR) repeat protein
MDPFIETQRRVRVQQSIVGDYISDLNDWLVVDKQTGPKRNAKESAEILRLQGNDLFKTKQYTEAAEKYTEAIAMHASGQLYSNRALCYWFRKQYEKCLSDCKASLKIQFGLKALFRKACSEIELGLLTEAKADLIRCQSVAAGCAPVIIEITQRMEEVDSRIRRIKSDQLVYARNKLCSTIPKWARKRIGRAILSPVQIATVSMGLAQVPTIDGNAHEVKQNPTTNVGGKYIPKSVRMREERCG